MKTIELPLKIVNQILSHAQSQAEEEICGLIAARDGQIKTTYPIENVASHRESLYQMDGKAQIDAMREMRENGEQLYAIYHSHPHSAAYPSATDLKEAQYSDAIYLIVSLDVKGVLDLRAYRLKNNDIESLKVVAQ
jgi:proteasome lid subunit RPN8/RPN11